MARPKSGIDWSLSPCCGEKPVKQAGLKVCPNCRREVRTTEPQGTGHRWDQLDREFDQENPKDRLRNKGRLDKPIDAELKP